MSKIKSELKASRKGKVGSLSLIGEIGFKGFGVDYRGFKQMLADLGKVDIIEVEINSEGGVVTDGVAIMNALVEQAAPVHVYINGLAASIASVIAMAGDKIFIPDNSMVFIHRPLNLVAGNADDMRKEAETLEKFGKVLVNSYMKHFKGTEEEMLDIMAKDTWLTADEMSDKFDNVVVMSSRGQKAVAKCDVVAEFGSLEEQPSLKESFVDRAVNALRSKVVNTVDHHNEEVDMSPEQMKELAQTVASAVAEAVKPKTVEEPVVAPVAKTEIAFEGDLTKIEDVEAHLSKVQLAELAASADMATSAGVAAYHKALAKFYGKESHAQQPATAQAPSTGVQGVQAVLTNTEAEVKAAAERMSKNIK